jgi:hypothetical protein
VRTTGRDHHRADLFSRNRKPRPMPTHRLSDSELDAVMAAARPLAVEMRAPFLQAVAHALAGRDIIGPGPDPPSMAGGLGAVAARMPPGGAAWASGAG